MGSHFVPALYDQIKLDVIEEQEQQQVIQETL